MKNYIICKVGLCTDCLQYIANGCFFAGQDSYDHQLLAMESAEHHLNKQGQKIFIDFSETHNFDEFSNVPCGHCKTKLAGSRYKADLVRVSDPESQEQTNTEILNRIEEVKESRV
jgi:hypothetical protein